jgi:hypothetical protein
VVRRQRDELLEPDDDLRAQHRRLDVFRPAVDDAVADRVRRALETPEQGLDRGAEVGHPLVVDVEDSLLAVPERGLDARRAGVDRQDERRFNSR